MSNDFQWFLGIDWGSEKHRLCLMDRGGKVLEQKWVEHNGSALADLVDWLRRITNEVPGRLAAAIEVPRGALVETLMEHGFAVFSINPKQLDRFRDRYSPAGAKDDARDALVLADSLRTDRHCFHAVRIDDPHTIRLRELSRLEDDLAGERNRLSNQLWEQLHRYFPALLQLSSSANEPWLWELLERAHTRAGRPTQTRSDRADSGAASDPPPERPTSPCDLGQQTAPPGRGCRRSGHRARLAPAAPIAPVAATTSRCFPTSAKIAAGIGNFRWRNRGAS